MNDLGWIVLEAAARVSALAGLGLAAAALLRRRGPAAGALVSSTTLMASVFVSGLAFSPWPRWWSPGDRSIGPAPRAGVPAPPRPTRDRPAIGGGPGIDVAASPTPGPDPSAGFAGPFLREFRRELAGPAGPPGSPGWRWPAWAAAGFLAGLAVATARLGLGLRAVGRLRARSRPVDDPSIATLMVTLRAEMGLGRAVEVRESAEVGTPATVGWRRPALLLPPSWIGWDDRERRAVLAHELAHVLRGDYLAGLAAQLSLSVHFYHPLVHALAARLRLQQELAADAWGARLSGGRSSYLITLANLALSQPPRATAWPARPFLPTRGTFLRRIEMLRDPDAIQPQSFPRRGQAAAVGVILAVGLAVAGLRSPASPSTAQAQAPGVLAPIQGPPPRMADIPGAGLLDPAAVGSDVHLVVEVRPAALLKNPEIGKLAGSIQAENEPAWKALASGEIEQVLILGFDRAGVGPNPGSSSQFAMALRASRPYDWKPFLGAGLVEVESDGVTYWRGPASAGSTCYRKLDDRTLLVGTEADAKVPPLGPGRPRGRHNWDDAWKKLGDGPVRVAFDTPWLDRRALPNLLPPGGPGLSAMKTTFGPLVDKARAYALTLGAADGLAIEALATAGTGPEAGRVADTLRAALTLARNTLPEARKWAEAGPAESARTLVDLVDALDLMLETARIDQQEEVVRLHVRTDAPGLATTARLLAPALRASRESARRAISMNHLKQISLAMHNYEAANETGFPPPSLPGPDGKTTHSWRVALLPLLGESELYSRYKFDEPWDGPNNIKLVPLMPAVFGHPPGPADFPRPGITSYFVSTGPETLFPDGQRGTRIAEITDGTSSTIMVLEARREVPWTKPEDIPFRADLRPTDLGDVYPAGHFVSLGDGSVRFLSATTDPTTFRAMLTRAGREVISLP